MLVLVIYFQAPPPERLLQPIIVSVRHKGANADVKATAMQLKETQLPQCQRNSRNYFHPLDASPDVLASPSPSTNLHPIYLPGTELPGGGVIQKPLSVPSDKSKQPSNQNTLHQHRGDVDNCNHTKQQQHFVRRTFQTKCELLYKRSHPIIYPQYLFITLFTRLFL